MSSFTRSSSSHHHSQVEPRMCNKDYIPPLLISMYNEQCEHVHSKFSESYSRYRQVVVEWMLDVAEYFRLDPTTTHAAVSYLDRLQPSDKYTRYEWQMLAIVCILISSKYNEREEDVPQIRKLEDITQQKITNEAVLSYELWALKKMSWKLNARTPISFLSAYMELGLLCAHDRLNNRLISQSLTSSESSSLRNDINTTVKNLAKKCLLYPDFKAIQASAVATAIVYCARKHHGISPIWCDEMSHLTFHDPKQSRSTSRALSMLESILATEQEENTEPQESNSEDEIEELLGAMEIHSTPNKEEREAVLSLNTPTVVATKVMGEISPASVFNIDGLK